MLKVFEDECIVQKLLKVMKGITVMGSMVCAVACREDFYAIYFHVNAKFVTL